MEVKWRTNSTRKFIDTSPSAAAFRSVSILTRRDPFASRTVWTSVLIYRARFGDNRRQARREKPRIETAEQAGGIMSGKCARKRVVTYCNENDIAINECRGTSAHTFSRQHSGRGRAFDGQQAKKASRKKRWTVTGRQIYCDSRIYWVSCSVGAGSCELWQTEKQIAIAKAEAEGIRLAFTHHPSHAIRWSTESEAWTTQLNGHRKPLYYYMWFDLIPSHSRSAEKCRWLTSLRFPRRLAYAIRALAGSARLLAMGRSIQLRARVNSLMHNIYVI